MFTEQALKQAAEAYQIFDNWAEPNVKF